MKANGNWKTIAGWVLHGLVGGIMLLAGSAKVLSRQCKPRYGHSAF